MPIRVLQLLALSTMYIAGPISAQVLFTEGFENTSFQARGWYDNMNLTLSTEVRPGSGSKSLQFKFEKGGMTPTSGGAIRRKITPSESVLISYYVKYSANWEGSNKAYHPHEIYLLSNLDGDWAGPSNNFLTVYVEQNEGTPMLAIQDAKNIDMANVNKDLTLTSENRAVAGCNGSSDRYQSGDCYRQGSGYYNGKSWRAGKVYFQDAQGKNYKADWHHVQAYIRLNSIVGGKGVADGQLRYWLDGELIMDHTDVMLRTAKNATMKLTQFVLAPYIGDGSPVEQSMWFDDLTVSASEPTTPILPGKRSGSAPVDRRNRPAWADMNGILFGDWDMLGRLMRAPVSLSP